jgi:hypothetical protein
MHIQRVRRVPLTSYGFLQWLDAAVGFRSPKSYPATPQIGGLGGRDPKFHVDIGGVD